MTRGEFLGAFLAGMAGGALFDWIASMLRLMALRRRREDLERLRDSEDPFE